jgi:hypothetical protein
MNEVRMIIAQLLVGWSLSIMPRNEALQFAAALHPWLARKKSEAEKELGRSS